MWKLGRRQKLIFVIILVITTVYGCSDSSKEYPIIKVDNAINAGNEIIEKFIGIDCLIPIRDNKILLGTCDKVLTFDSLIYILDQERILIINKEGMLHTEINHVGMGPGEYSKITDFEVAANGDVLLYCSNEQKVLTYSCCGDFISQQKVCDGTDICLLRNGDIAVYRNIYSDTIASVYRNGKRHSHYRFEDKRPNIVLQNGGGIIEYNDSLYLTNPMNYNIYRCENEKITPLVGFDFAEKNMPKEMLQEQDLRKILKMIHEYKRIYYIGSLSITQDFILLRPSDSRFIIYDKIEECTYRFNKIRNPYSSILSSPIYTTGYDNSFAGFVLAGNIENSLLPVTDSEVERYPFLKILQNSNTKDYLENDWIVVGHFK